MSDFTFNEFLTGILKFNDENIMHIGFNADTEDIIITNMNASADTAKTLQTNMNGGGGADLGQKTITVNGVYDASDDSLDGYDQVTVNVPPSGYTIDDVVTRTVSGDITLTSTYITGHGLEGCAITSLSSTTLTTINAYSIASCSSLTHVYLPELTTITNNNANAFTECTALTSISLPKLSSYSGCQNTFKNCTSLVTADLGLVGVNTSTFSGCSALRNLVLRKSSMVTLHAWSAADMGGIYNNPADSTIYVPEDLISSYEGATNWSSAYAAGVTFAKIEGSIYE